MAGIEAVLAAEAPAFARAVRAIVTGDTAGLTAKLAAEPALVSARSAASHHATLLHYVSANGIDEELQLPVPNADAVAAILLAVSLSVSPRPVERHSSPPPVHLSWAATLPQSGTRTARG